MRKMILAVAIIALALTTRSALAEEWTICLRKNGGFYRIGPEFSRQACGRRETQTTLNTEGPQGEKGDKGDTGEQGLRGPPALQGAGGVAFIHVDGEYGSVALLETGQVFSVQFGVWSELGFPPVPALPVPVSSIVAWEFRSFLTDTGDYWRWISSSWINTGTAP